MHSHCMRPLERRYCCVSLNTAGSAVVLCIESSARQTVVAGYCAQSAGLKLTGGQETENRQVAHRDALTALYREPTLT